MTEQENQTTGKEENRFRFTEKSVGDIPLRTDGKQVMYYDTLSELAVRVGARKKTFCIVRRMPSHGVRVRVSLGEYGEVSVTEARKMAAVEVEKIAAGINPHEVRKKPA